MIKKILARLGMFLALVVFIVAGYFAYLTIVDYKPEEKLVLKVDEGSKDKVKIGEDIKIITNNIGFGGMDKDVDCFLDGGRMTKAISKERVLYNIDKSYEILDKYKPDLVLFQELDLNSTRSYYLNEYEILKKKFKGYDSSLAINFDVPWIALPITKPFGKAFAGQANFSNKNILASERIALPIDESWPQRLADLDRALLITRLEVENKKQLVVINVHCSAYDKGGKIRKLQGKMISKVLEDEYKKGNYIIIGGDWNQAIPGSDASIFKTEEKWPDWLVEVPKSFKPKGFRWVFDKETPSCRDAGKKYTQGYNFLSIIDGFIVSDNIKVEKIKTIDTKFVYSDHNPVEIEIKLQ